ncbi:helix-turn-helix domain-containing protein [Elizabethkingia anophelis]|uniref:helix-turn-helix domain-containing protein n=1 Tax=Elizabethkingia anophelis TaxID=1117645 RepID=UPI003786F98E
MKEEAITKNNQRMSIAFSCYYQNNREGENYVEQDTLQFQISGTLTLFDGRKSYLSQKEGLRLIRRNQLMKFFKKPDEKQPFQSLSIYLPLDFLKSFARESPIKIDPQPVHPSVVELYKNNLLDSYLQSVQAYADSNELQDAAMIDAKLREGLLLVLKHNPEVAQILFDFSEPYKIDLQYFMEENFMFNVQIERFAYLTGRSLAAFKRDFQQEFGISPSRWLTKRRLEEAHKLLANTNKKASEIYMDLGFEDLSHFSHAFKRQYGVPPSSIKD